MKTCQKLGPVLALALGSIGTANAALLFETSSNLLEWNDAVSLGTEDWAQGEITISDCLNGCSLDLISLNVRSSSSSPNVVLTIRNTELLGSPIGSLSHSGTFPGSLDAEASSFTPDSEINLTNGNYWVRLQNLGDMGIQWGNIPGGTSTILDSPGTVPFADPNTMLMRVEGTPSAVPIPATAWLMGSALLGLVNSWRRKKE